MNSTTHELDNLPELNELIEIFDTLDIGQEITPEMSLEEICGQSKLSYERYREKLNNNPILERRISALLDKIGSYVETANAPHK